LALLNHLDANVRWWTCELLCAVTDGRATSQLCSVLLNDPASHVRLSAALSLGGTCDPTAIPALKRAAETDKGEDWEGRTVAGAARQAIERITSPPKPRWS
jgi:HEAT repeat protein